ncbi:MAG: hypothetical protein AVO35_05275 [Candidatus Aegiribacteria sp. MLS_C]|nr:MAG: hypothetical protein AVO35_05275 [Candidatus Aegiribacteria sp. MLS_C]
MGRLAAAAALLMLLSSCAPSSDDAASLRSQAEVYSSRTAFAWENLSTFRIRGNARLDGESLVARGPFVLWGDPHEVLLRGDFYGPDGRPVVSLRGDTSGLTVYLPQEEYAFFTPIGLQAGEGTIRTRDLIFLLRTGFPVMLESWQISDLADCGGGSVVWEFLADGDTMSLMMESGGLFPSVCSWGNGGFSIDAASPHDEYRAWPWKWTTSMDSNAVEIELTESGTRPVPAEGIWNMAVPFPPETLLYRPVWRPADSFMRR